MKAINIDNKIKVFTELPSNWKHYVNFKKASLELQHQEGFYDVIKPIIDTELQLFGDMYFDEVNNVFTYPVIDRVFDVETERSLKKAEFKNIIESEMNSALSVGVLEKLVLGETIPQAFKDSVIALRAREASIYAALDVLTDGSQIKKFKFDRTEIELTKDLLKSGRKTI